MGEEAVDLVGLAARVGELGAQALGRLGEDRAAAVHGHGHDAGARQGDVLAGSAAGVGDRAGVDHLEGAAVGVEERDGGVVGGQGGAADVDDDLDDLLDRERLGQYRGRALEAGGAQGGGAELVGQAAAHLLGLTLGGDVGVGAHPLDHAAVADDRDGPDLEVAVAAGAGADAVGPLEHGPAAQGLAPGLLGGGAVVGVDGVEPAVGEVFLQPLAGDGAPFRRVFDHRAAGRGDPDELLLGLDERAVALLAAAQVVFGGLAFGEVDAEQGGADRGALVVVEREERDGPVAGVAVLGAGAQPLVGDGKTVVADPAQGGVDHVGQVGRQDVGGEAVDMPVDRHPGQLGKGRVDTDKTARGVEECEGVRGLRHEALEQGRV